MKMKFLRNMLLEKSTFELLFGKNVREILNHWMSLFLLFIKCLLIRAVS